MKPSSLRRYAACIAGLSLLPAFNIVHAQVRVKDSGQGTPVSYANIQLLDGESGISADEQGRFSLPRTDSAKTIVVSAAGYESRRVTYLSDTVILLHKAMVNLPEVVISNERKDRLARIGSYRKSDIRIHFGTGHQPWILARYFPYADTYRQTPFLKSMMLETESEVKDALFNLRLYRAGKDGRPGEFLYSGNIIGHAKKGKRNTVVDLSALHILFPEEGLYVGVEFMFIEQNRHTVEFVEEGKRGRRKEDQYAPQIGSLPADSDDKAMVFLKGRWEKIWRNTGAFLPKAYRNRYSVFAMELTLSD